MGCKVPCEVTHERSRENTLSISFEVLYDQTQTHTWNGNLKDKKLSTPTTHLISLLGICYQIPQNQLLCYTIISLNQLLKVQLFLHFPLISSRQELVCFIQHSSVKAFRWRKSHFLLQCYHYLVGGIIFTQSMYKTISYKRMLKIEKKKLIQPCFYSGGLRLKYLKPS